MHQLNRHTVVYQVNVLSAYTGVVTVSNRERAVGLLIISYALRTMMHISFLQVRKRAVHARLVFGAFGICLGGTENTPPLLLGKAAATHAFVQQLYSHVISNWKPQRFKVISHQYPVTIENIDHYAA